MDATRRLVIAHEGRGRMNPLGFTAVNGLVDALALRPGARVLELCCGKADALVEVVSWSPGVSGVGVDRVEALLAAGRAAADREGVGDRVQLQQGDARDTVRSARGLHVVLCIGARPWGSLEDAVQALLPTLRPGGRLVLGGEYRSGPVPPGWIDFLDGEDDRRDLADSLGVGAAAGLDLEYWAVASPQELDAYEGETLRACLSWARSHASDPAAEGLALSARRWRDAWLRHGRDNAGYFLASWRKP
ncbi:MAG: class I SAM-dependent methyltransferase [Alphaproteobacteria bacterium]|nr:class I SAM-dependent methyltransferase [Alphaproteobacteria bacterium]